MDGLLILDKPSGPTSHDVVARLRRALGERRIGHTGTLDPMATGVLPLVVGRATRLARFLNDAGKSYDAEILLGIATDTCDAEGRPIGDRYDGPWPAAEVIDRALDKFRGTFLQQPPAFSAKKIGGRRSYALARARRSEEVTAVAPAPVSVTASVSLVRVEANRVFVTLDCSAGFYVRALASDLGAALGTGAHLAALRRTRSGRHTIASAVTLDVAEREPARASAALVPLVDVLGDWPRIALTAEGVGHAVNGRDLGPADVADSADFALAILPASAGGWRLVGPDGTLVAIAERASRPGLLHPSVVLR